MRPALRAALALAAWVMVCAAAADPADRLSNPAQEARARALFHDIRCLVCQSESIDESDADLARDLRQLVRQQVAEGRSDDQIRAYLVSRYGEFVLLTPRLTLGNSLLWAGPAAVLAIGLAVLVFRRRAPAGSEGDALDVEEEAAVRRLIDEDAEPAPNSSHAPMTER